VTTRAIAEAFDNGMEYFNTFGGNPVSAAIGLAVLDVIEEEGLREHARVTGEQLMAGLRQIAARHDAIGDVRGLGLFVGIELVRDSETREPDAALARELANRAAERGVLLSTDGPDHNVMKIKPPLVFSAADADRLVETVDAVLAEVATR
jgi:4-aminobutyrate aminotransferase-like enzyme